jgi:hypothetical protein
VSDIFVRLMLAVICAAIAHLYWLEGSTKSTVFWSISAALWVAAAGIMFRAKLRDRNLW